MLRSGKYRGFSFEHVMTNDRRYCGWLLDGNRERDLPKDLRRFARHLEDQCGGLLVVGAHKGKAFLFGGDWVAVPNCCCSKLCKPLHKVPGSTKCRSATVNGLLSWMIQAQQ